MVLNRIDTQNNLKNSYNMNTKSKENADEIPRLHSSWGIRVMKDFTQIILNGI